MSEDQELEGALQKDMTDLFDVTAELRLFNCMFPNSTDKEKIQFLTQKKLDHGLVVNNHESKRVNPLTQLSFNAAGGKSFDLASMSGKSRSMDDANPRSTMLKAMASARNAYLLVDEPGDEEIDNNKKDVDLEDWQAYLVSDISSRRKGEKKTLPVIISSSRCNSTITKKIQGGKAKRWGSGALVRLASESEEAPIDGPPGYLEVHKNHFKNHASQKLLQKVAKDIKDAGVKTVF